MMKLIRIVVLGMLICIPLARAQVYNYFPPPGITYTPATGMSLGTATGGVQGAGTINAQQLYVNGSPVATSAGGTVSSVSVVSANGLSGTVANPTTTPAITLAPTFTGIALSNGSGFSAASVTGTGAVVQATSPTLVTPTLGAATATTINGSTVPTSAGTLPGSTGSFTLDDCLEVGSTSPLEIEDAGAACGSGGGGSGFASLTSGVNTTATMQVGAGASLSYTSTGVVDANEVFGTSVTGTTGSGGSIVFATSPTLSSPTLTTPNLGTPSALNLANATNVQSSALPATIASNTTGNAATASSLASNPSTCSDDEAAAGITANGSATGCFPVVLPISSGTVSLGTSAIASGTCASTISVSASGVSTSDVIGWGFDADPTGTAGYEPSVTGMLTIISWPTSGGVNFAVCNNTSSSITPGGVVLNWAVKR